MLIYYFAIAGLLVWGISLGWSSIGSRCISLSWSSISSRSISLSWSSWFSRGSLINSKTLSQGYESNEN